MDYNIPMPNNTLNELKANLENARAIMHQPGQGGQAPNAHWFDAQLNLIRMMEEAGIISAEWNGLFVGLLDDLMLQKRHCDRYLERMEQIAASENPNREHLRMVVDEAMNSQYKHQKACTDFIAKFGDRLALKATP